MYPILFSVGNITIYSFGLFLSVSILVCGIILYVLARLSKLDTTNYIDKYLLVVFIGIICARVAYAIIYPDAFKSPAGSFWSLFALWQGGLVFYGAMIGGLLSFILIFRKNRLTLLKWLDIVFITLMMGMSIGQVGCTLGGCSVGATTSVAISINHKIPASLYESIFVLILFTISLLYYLYNRTSGKYKNGSIFVIGMAIFFAGRMIVDYFKISKYSLWGVTAYLWVDIIIALVILFMLVSHLLLKLKNNKIKAA